MSLVEKVQKLVVRLLATSPAGHNLFLIGGFRYRFLDGSFKMSSGVDYHWEHDLIAKQDQLLSFFKRKLVPEVDHSLGYEGKILPVTVKDKHSPPSRSITLTLTDRKGLQEEIKVPVSLTRAVCLDAPVTRTVEGVVYATIADADMIENTVLSLFNRAHIDERDLVDLFLFEHMLTPHSAQRIVEKMVRASLSAALVKERFTSLVHARAAHQGAIKDILDTQLDPHCPVAVKGINASMVFERVCDILQKRL